MRAGLAVVLFGILLLQGCATFVHGTRQDVAIKTDPPGLLATIKAGTCITPCTMNVSRKANYLTLQKGKYEREYTLDRDVDFYSAVLGNIYNLVLPGFLVDAATGAMYEIQPVNIQFIESETGAEHGQAAAQFSEPILDNTTAVVPFDFSRDAGTPDKTPVVERIDTVSAGILFYSVNGASGMMDYAGFERLGGRSYSVYAKVGYLDYASHDNAYEDASHGAGGEIGLRFYRRDSPLQGWYLGCGFGVWPMRGHWKDDVGTPFVTSGSGKTTLMDLDFHVGFKWGAPLERVFIDPSLGVGLLISNGIPDPFGWGGGYANAGLAIGVRW